MAWGSFIKKIKAFGDKTAKTVGNVSKFVSDKVLPGAKKIMDVVAPMVPYGGLIQQGLDFVEKVTDETKNFEDSESMLKSGENRARRWMENYKRNMK